MYTLYLLSKRLDSYKLVGRVIVPLVVPISVGMGLLEAGVNLICDSRYKGLADSFLLSLNLSYLMLIYVFSNQAKISNEDLVQDLKIVDKSFILTLRVISFWYSFQILLFTAS